jgi:hypothetical protein
MTFTLHRIAPFIVRDIASVAAPTKARGRPRGPSSRRKPIPLPAAAR